MIRQFPKEEIQMGQQTCELVKSRKVQINLTPVYTEFIGTN